MTTVAIWLLVVITESQPFIEITAFRSAGDCEGVRAEIKGAETWCTQGTLVERQTSIIYPQKRGR